MTAAAPSLRPSPGCRVIVDNDFSGDPDGLVALAHHLLSPTNRVTAVTSSFVNPELVVPGPRATDGADLAGELLEVIGGLDRLPVVAGSERAFVGTDENRAADTILEEARREDELPLFLVCGGPLTNLAAALQRAPDIAARLTLVWIGGSSDPAAYEYNRDTDPAAASFVLQHGGLEVHQFPLEAYRQCAYSVAELEQHVGGAGAVGRWLFHHFTGPHPDWVRIGGVWPLGDSPPVLVTALGVESSEFKSATVDDGSLRRTFTRVDFRLLVGDMLAKLHIHEKES